VRRKFLYDFADRYVLLSDRFFGEFRVMAGLGESHKLRSIPNPMAVQLQMAECPKKNEVVFCATLTNLKGCDMLLEAWAKIADVEKDWHLTIVGDGPQRGELESFAKERNLPRIEFVGYQSDPSPYFARAKILAFPSRREGWGLVLVEAMANGCVPVAFDSYGAVHDIIGDGVNGFIVPAFDIDGYAAALRKLMDDADMFATMQSAALCVPDRFAVEKVAAKWEVLFAELGG
jgi:glycosyltransferase involved in cell wall biosynthesis